MARTSAGLVLHRDGESGCEVLLGHMGGPMWRRRPRAWTVLKGEVDPGEEPHAAAVREFAEEVGVPAPEGEGADVVLGEVVQSGGKRVLAWMRTADLDVARLPAPADDVVVEWPPRSGRRVAFPEIDEVRWWPLAQAGDVVVQAQQELLARVERGCPTRRAAAPGQPGVGPASLSPSSDGAEA